MINPLKTNDAYRLSMHPETFSFIFSHILQFHWEIGSAWAEMVGEGEVGDCTCKQHAWPWLYLALKSPWLEHCWASRLYTCYEWVWLETWIYLGLLSATLRAVWGMWTKLNIIRDKYKQNIILISLPYVAWFVKG